MTEFILGAAVGAALIFLGSEVAAERAEREHEKQVRRLIRAIRELHADKQAMAQLFVRSVPEEQASAKDEHKTRTMQKIREDWARAMENLQ
ncbi:MAG: hypothetical protein II008_11820 [Oscillospiraceae bacterium]|nr:hypothetical protein [Oscillospiraceae bacterium]